MMNKFTVELDTYKLPGHKSDKWFATVLAEFFAEHGVEAIVRHSSGTVSHSEQHVVTEFKVREQGR